VCACVCVCVCVYVCRDWGRGRGGTVGLALPLVCVCGRWRERESMCAAEELEDYYLVYYIYILSILLSAPYLQYFFFLFVCFSIPDCTEFDVFFFLYLSKRL